MGKLSNIGHALYEGRVSIDFVGRKWLWYGISALILVAAVGGLVGKGVNYGIEFEGGVEYQVAMPAGQATEANVQKIRDAVAQEADTKNIDAALSPTVNVSGDNNIRVQTEPLNTDDSADISSVIQKSVGVNSDAISSDSIGATWGAGRPAGAARPGRLPGPGGAVHLGLLPGVEDVGGRDRRAGPRPAHHRRHLRAVRLRGHARDRHRHPDHPRFLALRHRRRVRQGPGEHQEPRRTRQTYAEAANLAINQTLVRSINTSIVALLPVGALLYVGVCSLGSGALKDLALALFVGMAAGAYSSIFIATPLVVQLKEREPGVAPATPAPCGTAAGTRWTATPRSRRSPTTCRCTTSPRRATPGPRARTAASRRRPGWPGGRARPRRRRRRAASVTSGVAVRVRQAGAALPEAALAAGQGIWRHRAVLDPGGLVDRLVHDVPDFPSRAWCSRTSRRCWPTTPVHHRRRRARRRGPGRRRPWWSTRSWAWRPAASSSAAPVA